MAKTLHIGNATFTAKEKLGAKSVIAFSKAISEATDASSVVVLYDFVQQQLLADERERFAAWFDEHGDDISIQDFNEAVGNLMVEYSDRPTERPSGSPTGVKPTGLPSRVVSLSRGTDKEASPSSKAGQQAVS